jgi:hypothetical protein
MGEWMYRSMVFLTSALVGGEWSASRPGQFTPGHKARGTHLIRSVVGPRTDLDDVEKRKFLTLPGLELWHLSHPARKQSLLIEFLEKKNTTCFDWLAIIISWRFLHITWLVNCILLNFPRGAICGLSTMLEAKRSRIGEVVSLTLRPPFTPREIPGTHFC